MFGNAQQIFTCGDDVDYYYFVLPFEAGDLTTIFVKIYHPLKTFEEKWNPKKLIKKFIEFIAVNYRKVKDPPSESHRGCGRKAG